MVTARSRGERDRERELDELWRRFRKMKVIERVCSVHLIKKLTSGSQGKSGAESMQNARKE